MSKPDTTMGRLEVQLSVWVCEYGTRCSLFPFPSTQRAIYNNLTMSSMSEEKHRDVCTGKLLQYNREVKEKSDA